MTVQSVLKARGKPMVTVLDATRVSKVLDTMHAEDIGAVVVTDALGKIIGLLSEHDIIKAIGEFGDAILKVPTSSIMTQDVATCSAETSIDQALTLMKEKRIRDLPVLQGEEILGVVNILDALEVSLDLARRASKEQETFLSEVSHELRTSLNNIIGFSELIVQGKGGAAENEAYWEYANNINESGQNLFAVIDNICEAANIEALSLSGDYIVVPDLIQSAVAACETRRSKKNVEIEVKEDEGPCRLWADSERVSRILFILLTDAIKRSERGGTIEVSTRCSRKFGYFIFVSDACSSISQEGRAKIRNVDDAGSGRSQSQADGMGLSLSLAKRLAELHGGALHIESDEDGNGNAVMLRFPPHRIQPVTEDHPPAVEQSSEQCA